eukprot:CAMPEP_0117826370 /NCGR_PEP_ID=MMETSP0949-20121206/6044_1 /TAXON_ID=44440 /ORGANISM="Chattonella subsalsa, Strain CCMP2191" /LENGTH=313 /DNA_ID=CAMNT_0005666545 /DNA_START=178 /DNA_END=1121 /DNA_ORIENTATION=-
MSKKNKIEASDAFKDEWRMFGYVSFLVSFALVFFLTECYKKYRSDLQCITRVIQRINEVSATSRIIFKKEIQYSETIVRLLNSHHLFFYELANVHPNVWRESVVTKNPLLTSDEFEALKSLPDSWYYICLCWIIDAMETFFLDIVKNESESTAIIVSKSYQQMLDRVLQLRAELAQIGANEDCEKIPFAYYNPFYLILYVVICMGFLSLFYISLELADPFGSDDCDIKVPVLLNGCIEGTEILMCDESILKKWSSLSATKASDYTKQSSFMKQCHQMIKEKRDEQEQKWDEQLLRPSEFARSLGTLFVEPKDH